MPWPPPPFVQSAQHHLAARAWAGGRLTDAMRVLQLAHAAKGDARRGDVLAHGAGRAVCAPGMSSIGTARATQLRRRRCPCRCRRLGCRRRCLPSHGSTMKRQAGTCNLHQRQSINTNNGRAGNGEQSTSINERMTQAKRQASGGGAATDCCRCRRRCRHSGCSGRCHCLHWYCCM